MLRAGDRVAYSAHFLRSIQAPFDVASMRGTVEEVTGQFVRVNWDDERSMRAHVSNIARVGSVAFGDPTVKPR